MFFLGILMAVDCLDASGLLKDTSAYLDATLPNEDVIAAAIGVASAVIDNVPLVAGTMGMYDLNQVREVCSRTTALF